MLSLIHCDEPSNGDHAVVKRSNGLESALGQVDRVVRAETNELLGFGVGRDLHASGADVGDSNGHRLAVYIVSCV